MSKIAGTIISIEDYLSPSSKEIRINDGKPDANTIVFNENRKYEIPLFQREIRWTSDNVKRLLSDLNSGSKFLGNIILSINSDNYEIIDGQQRTTIILLILYCIKKIHGNAIEVFDTCELINHSFTGLKSYIDNDCDMERLDEIEKAKIIESDKYKQRNRIKDLTDSLLKEDILKKRRRASALLTNLKKSEVNIIVSQADTEAASIQYFLDVNLKGVKLDTEDIFKGYLFSKDTSREIRLLWQNNKQLVHELNSYCQSKNKKKTEYYPLMKFYEHYFQCELEKNDDYRDKKITYGTDFCLKNEVSIDGSDYYEGTHLIEVICDNDFMKQAMISCKRAIEIISNIIRNSSINNEFKQLFNCNELDKKGNPVKIDDQELQCFYYMMRTILLNKDVTPKILTFKYILEYLDGKNHKKSEYKSIYSVYTAAILFIVFSTKKDNNTFTSIVNQDNFSLKLAEWIDIRLNSIELSIGKLGAAYKYAEQEDDESNRDQQFICKAVAILYNFIKITKNNNNEIIVDCNNKSEMLSFFSNPEKYSLEHFIIAESGNLEIKYNNNTISIPYPRQIKRYRNSLFNYIFIPKTINKDLGNGTIFQKYAYLETKKKDLVCKYSLEYLSKLKDSFSNYPTQDRINQCANEDEVKKLVNHYFEDSQMFLKEFLQFSTSMAQSIKISS